MEESVLVHSGGVHGGHYYAYIRPTLSDQWNNFNDERVTKEDMKESIRRTVWWGGIGGFKRAFNLDINLLYLESMSNSYQMQASITLRLSSQKYSNAYMIVYIRDIDKDKIICNVDEKDIAEHLRVRLKKEQEEKEHKKKEKA